MLPALLALAAVGGVGHHVYKHRKRKKAGFVIPKPKGKTAKATVVAHGEALSSERKQLHARLLCKVHDPAKLMQAASMFRNEGLYAHGDVLESKANQVQGQMATAAEWVDRARAGDQNAMGSIAATRDSANKGSQRAIVSCYLMDMYMRANPVSPASEAPSEEAPAE